MEQKFRNIQTGFNLFINTCINGPILMESKQNKHGEGYNAHPKVRSKNSK